MNFREIIFRWISIKGDVIACLQRIEFVTNIKSSTSRCQRHDLISKKTLLGFESFWYLETWNMNLFIINHQIDFRFFHPRFFDCRWFWEIKGFEATLHSIQRFLLNFNLIIYSILWISKICWLSNFKKRLRCSNHDYWNYIFGSFVFETRRNFGHFWNFKLQWWK